MWQEVLQAGSDGTTKVSELVKITSLVESGQISTYTVTEEHDIIVIIGGAGPVSYGSNNKGVGLEQFVSNILHNGCYVGGIANAKVGDTQVGQVKGEWQITVVGPNAKVKENEVVPVKAMVD